MAEYKAVKLMQNGNEYCFPTSGCEYGFIDLLVVGGGGAGGSSANSSGGSAGGGGGGGGVVYCCGTPLPFNTLCCPVSVGCGGTPSNGTDYTVKRGGPSYFGSCIAGSEFYAYGGGVGGGYCPCSCNDLGGASGGGGGGTSQYGCNGGNGTQGCKGGQGYCAYGGGGGGGAAEAGCNYHGTNGGGKGGNGISNNISGVSCYYGGGGGGGATKCNANFCGGVAGCGGGKGGKCCETGCKGSWYGGGGGGGGQNCLGGCGCQGVVFVRYHTDGSDGLLPTSTGGTRYTCGVYTIHRFDTVGCVQYFHPVFKY